ncbi:Protein disulfide-isomerase tigA [Penicillium atrosanguineum]|uniref:Protein disulfide-isomerase tigA n=1 Tax=Penicillium atrosanguineum TaxID=1132637 RepID=UPI0023910723|nr:Protein disulfide-isomerase tigA [Penicillium atrosanguineum]KAJ5309908.1 Protein disulfide-isomerase tigA [Penicillium atrosanguineum]
MSGEKILEGVFAVHKPQGVTSADVLRTLQKHFNPSKAFKPWLDEEKARRDRESQFQKKRRRHPKRCEVKLGHGGTLDPLATGVLVAGVGKGTKSLQDFLGCTKSYETIVLFGAETDSYDRLGKVVRRAPYEHITREAVEKALEQFRGKIMQRPPIFSALRVEGKKLYEYAREGKMPPVEIKERPVEVISMDVVEWYEPGTHDFKWPDEEMTGDAKIVAEKLLDKESALSAASEGEAANQESSNKRKSPPPADSTEEDQEAGKKQKVSEDGVAQAVATETVAPEPATGEAPTTEVEQPKPQPAAVKISMTVTSGFYVRSLAHDLGKAVGSCGLMSELVRSRQADFVLESDKILEYKDLEAGEEVWGPKVQKFLEEWEAKRAAKAEAESQQ